MEYGSELSRRDEVEDTELVVPDDFDDEQYSDDELQMMADDDKCAIVSYLHKEEVQP